MASIIKDNGKEQEVQSLDELNYWFLIKQRFPMDSMHHMKILKEAKNISYNSTALKKHLKAL